MYVLVIVVGCVLHKKLCAGGWVCVAYKICMCWWLGVCYMVQTDQRNM